MKTKSSNANLMKTEFKIKIENAQAAYNVANEETKKVLVALLGSDFTPEDNRPITERVKTYEDACKVLGVEPTNFDGMPHDVMAYLKLRTITEALNEGWIPQFGKDEYRYYPWFFLYTQQEIDEMSEDEKENLTVLSGGYALNGSGAGLASPTTYTAPSSSSAYIGSRLCYKNRELAIYSGKQFAHIWADFVLVRKSDF